MSEIKRYNSELEPSPTGGWVDYDDCQQALAAVNKRIAELEAENDRLKLENATVLAKSGDLCLSLAKCREALEGLQHADGCYCDAAFSCPGSHPQHSDECIQARDALAEGQEGTR